MAQQTNSQELFEQLAVVGKAFASAKRLEIVEVLSQGERSVESLAEAAGLGLTTTSAHLQILKMARLVRTRRAGTRIFYRLAGDDVLALYGALGSVARAHSADVDRARRAYLGLGAVDDVAEVERGDLWGRLRAGHDVTLLDVRPRDEYAAGHIPGAVSVPFGELVADLHRIDRADEVVAYCRGAYCVMASDAVRLLKAHGRRAQRLEDGMLEWRLAGLPVEVGT